MYNYNIRNTIEQIDIKQKNNYNFHYNILVLGDKKMNFIKNFTAVMTLVLFIACSVVFAEGITQNAAGDYVYQTTMSSLVSRRVYEEIKLINNSSYALTHVTCTITINGKNHDMRPMPVLKLSDSEGFDGYYEDDMNREFPRYFGKDGKFSRNNNNVVTFTFKFRDHANAVAITDVYDGEEDLCFVVSDNLAAAPVVAAPAVATPAPAPQPAVVPAQQQTAAQQQTTTPQNNANSGNQVVNIGGKNYLIHDGKAYPIQ